MMSRNDGIGNVQRDTCLRAMNKLLFRLVEGQWIFVPKNEQEATVLLIFHSMTSPRFAFT
jgi:hypothetical protein